jgi:hypothetical protein
LHVPEGTTDHHNGDTLNELIGPQQTKEMIYHDVPHEIGVAIHPKRPAGTANDQNKKQWVLAVSDACRTTHNTKDLAKEMLVEQQLPLTQTRQWKTMEDNGRRWKTMEDNGRQWKTIKYNGRQPTCIVNAQVYLLVLLTNGAGAGAGAIATPQQ